jgi:periplasmic divalent cation tolerance protein
MDAEYGMALTTFPDEASAERLVDGLLDRRLVACAQTLPIRSAYRWKGEICREREVLVLLKIKTALYPQVEAYVRAEHPYETPQLVLVPFAAGLPAYLRWIDESSAPA